ncbi:response regulator [Tenacibaculum sp. 190524A05c]|uniref:dolichyl-phosphate beta-glucosyltransferase n=1 Tax=Tenacibaculum platacis TaxID=3137852 RepID=A0ABM9P4N5_9FLAO
MKILNIDEKKLTAKLLERRLSNIGYHVTTVKNGKEAVEQLKVRKPNLVILDVNMSNFGGIDVLKFIKESGLDTKVMVISGEKEQALVSDLFEYGIDEYIKKPATLTEILIRINKLVGMSSLSDEFYQQNEEVVRELSIGVVIPCYNEASRLLSKSFVHFVSRNVGYYLCFVNDGSTDNTLEVLEEMKQGREDYIGVYNCDTNGGKAEAVRQGMLHLINDNDLALDYLGFLDADLSTDLNDFDDLVKTINLNNYKIVSGSRISRIGANISRESARQVISMSINYIIRKILGMNFKDTQCGAKILDREAVKTVFNEKFLTRWLFDVEIFLRMKKRYGMRAKEMIYEQPLKRWVHADGSKLSMRDSLKIGTQLVKIAAHYK